MDGFINVLFLISAYIAVIWYLGYKEYKSTLLLLSYLENNHHDKWHYLSNDGAYIPILRHSIFTRFHKFLKSDVDFDDIQIKYMKNIIMNFYRKRLRLIYLLPIYTISVCIIGMSLRWF